MKNKYKSYSFWTALSGAVVILLNALGDCFGFSIDNEVVSGVIIAIAGLLVVLGVVSMPKNQADDSDSKEDKSDSSNSSDENDEENK